MKKWMMGTVLVIGMMTTANLPVKSQVSVNINIGAQPLWGPVGYDYVEYYYFPDLEVYYYVPTHQFIYLSGGRWIFAAGLPVAYRHYDLYTIHKVVINEPRPYRHFHVHKVKYAGYKGGPRKQVMIRDSRDPKYFIVKGHPHHGKVKSAGTTRKNNGPAVKRATGGKKGRDHKNTRMKNAAGNQPVHKIQGGKPQGKGQVKSGGGQNKGNRGNAGKKGGKK